MAVLAVERSEGQVMFTYINSKGYDQGKYDFDTIGEAIDFACEDDATPIKIQKNGEDLLCYESLALIIRNTKEAIRLKKLSKWYKPEGTK